MDEDEDSNDRPVHKANLNSEFLQHPESGAFFRNPLRGKSALLPTLLSAGEYEHNCLDEALRTCPCIKISESNFRKLIGDEEAPSLASTLSGPSAGASSGSASSVSTPRSTPSSARSMQRRVQLNKLPEVSVGCDIFVHLSVQGSEHGHHIKSHEPKKDAPSGGGGGQHRRERRQQQDGAQAMKEVQLENLSIDVSGLESQLQVARIREGPVARWNRIHPELQVKAGDHIVRVNGHRRPAPDMAAELGAASGNFTLVARRPSISHKGARSSRMGTPLLPSTAP